MTNQIRFLCVALFSCIGVMPSAMAAEILPFSTDGCSAFPDGSLRQKKQWQDCCIAHDLAYWVGGTYQDRAAVDEAFAECVADVSNSALATTMKIGVRAGGSPFFPTTYRWGYGWPHFRGYAPLTEEEKRAAIEAIDQAPAEAFIAKNPFWLIDFDAWKKK